MTTPATVPARASFVARSTYAACGRAPPRPFSSPGRCCSPQEPKIDDVEIAHHRGIESRQLGAVARVSKRRRRRRPGLRPTFAADRSTILDLRRRIAHRHRHRRTTHGDIFRCQEAITHRARRAARPGEHPDSVSPLGGTRPARGDRPATSTGRREHGPAVSPPMRTTVAPESRHYMRNARRHAGAVAVASARRDAVTVRPIR